MPYYQQVRLYCDRTYCLPLMREVAKIYDF